MAGHEPCGSTCATAKRGWSDWPARSIGSSTHAGWVLDPKPFRPHLTLARSDGVPAGAAIGARLIEAAEDIEVRFRAERVGLFESLTGGGPARYEPVEVVDLT